MIFGDVCGIVELCTYICIESCYQALPHVAGFKTQQQQGPENETIVQFVLGAGIEV